MGSRPGSRLEGGVAGPGHALARRATLVDACGRQDPRPRRPDVARRRLRRPGLGDRSLVASSCASCHPPRPRRPIDRIDPATMGRRMSVDQATAAGAAGASAASGAAAATASRASSLTAWTSAAPPSSVSLAEIAAS